MSYNMICFMYFFFNSIFLYCYYKNIENYEKFMFL